MLPPGRRRRKGNPGRRQPAPARSLGTDCYRPPPLAAHRSVTRGRANKTYTRAIGTKLSGTLHRATTSAAACRAAAMPGGFLLCGLRGRMEPVARPGSRRSP
jgi:hypothetical protein